MADSDPSQENAKSERAEEALRAQEAKYRHLVEQLPVITYTAAMDSVGSTVFVSPQIEAVLGEPAETWSNDPTLWSSRVHPDDREHVLAAWNEACRTDEPLRVEYRMTAHDGSVRWFYDEARIVRDAQGKPLVMQGVMLDISQRKQVEEQLREARQRLDNVVASSPAVLYTLALEGENFRITWVTDNIQELLGLQPHDTYQPGWWQQRLHPDDRAREEALLQGDLLTHGRAADEFRIRHQDGSYRWVRGELRLLRGATGRQPVEVVGSLMDITKRKQLEDQYHQAQKMEAIGTLAGGVAHDFNNLLTVINGNCDLLLTALNPGDPVRDQLTEIHTAGIQAASLTRQLLMFSRQQVVEPNVLDLNGVVVDTEKMLRRLIGEDIIIIVNLDPALSPVKADSGQFKQVLANLAVNSRDAMPQGGRLTIETRNVLLDTGYAETHPGVRPGDYILLTVSDTGTGMDAQTKVRIFEPFFTTKEATKGTGLGLAVVHGVITQSGGHIDAYSEVGKGTTFKIYLPAVEEQLPGCKSISGLHPMPHGSETVLLVEDEDAVRTLAGRVLKSCGYRVLEAVNGQEAVRFAEAHPGRIDLLVSDVVMPYLGGRQLIERLAAVMPDIKVLFVSGHTDDAVVRHGVLEAEYTFLQKPFTPTVLAQKVREVLDQER